MSLTKVFKSNHHDFAFSSRTLIFPMWPLQDLAPGVSTVPTAAGVTEHETEFQTIYQCPVSVYPHGKHPCDYSQGLVKCKL